MKPPGTNVVLICADADIAKTVGDHLSREGHNVRWDAGAGDGSGRRRAKRLRATIGVHSTCVYLLAQEAPRGRKLYFASGALGKVDSSRFLTVLLGRAPEPAQLPRALRHAGELVGEPGLSADDAATRLINTLNDRAPRSLPSPAGGHAAGPLPDVVDLDPEDAAQGARRGYAARRYAGDRHPGALWQWFAPLPSGAGVRPRTRYELDRLVPLRISGPAAERLLAEATAAYERREERIKASETKASTLVATVGIAAGLIVPGASLFLDQAKVGPGWSELLMAIVAALLVFLLACGFTASRALLRVLHLGHPSLQAAITRATYPDALATRSRAIELLDRAGHNLYVADYKAAQVRIAYRWYRLALASLVILGLTTCLYVLVGDPPAAGGSSPH